MKLKLTGIVLAMFCMGCNTEPTTHEKHTIEIKFDQVFGNQEFKLGKTYTLAGNETVKVDMLKYIVGNFEFERQDGFVFTVDTLSSYLLVDEEKENETRISFKIPFFDIKKIRFKVGVDATSSQLPYEQVEKYPALAHKSEGHDMAWDWNKGYIFFKAEGSSSLHKAWMYHVGLYGRDGSVNNIRQVELTLDQALTVSDGSVHVIADVKKVWNNISTQDFYKVMVSPKQSPTIADNVSKMFAIDHVH